jgi:hypothetical protein
MGFRHRAILCGKISRPVVPAFLILSPGGAIRKKIGRLKETPVKEESR